MDAILLRAAAALAAWAALAIMTCHLVLAPRRCRPATVVAAARRRRARDGRSPSGGAGWRERQRCLEMVRRTEQANATGRHGPLLALGVGAQPILLNFTSGLLLVLFRPFRVGRRARRREALQGRRDHGVLREGDRLHERARQHRQQRHPLRRLVLLELLSQRHLLSRARCPRGLDGELRPRARRDEQGSGRVRCAPPDCDRADGHTSGGSARGCVAAWKMCRVRPRRTSRAGESNGCSCCWSRRHVGPKPPPRKRRILNSLHEAQRRSTEQLEASN